MPFKDKDKARAYEREHQRETRAGALALGMCQYCRKRDVMPEKKGCEQCLEKAREKARVKRENRRRNLLCHQCGKRAVLPGRRCSICQKKNKMRQKNDREVIKRMLDALEEYSEERGVIDGNN